MALTQKSSVNDVLEHRVLSQSAINKFIECRRQYKLSHIDGKKDERESGLDRGFRYDWLGRVIHKILEEFYLPQNFPSDNDLDKDGSNKIEAVLLTLLDKHWDYGQPQLHLIDAKGMLKMFAYRESERWKVYRADPDTILNFIPQYREFTLEDTDNLRLKAIMDVMWLDKDGKINPYPRDYKTNKKAEISQEMKLQALVTAMLINNVLDQMPTHFEFLFLRTNKSLLYEITTEGINKAIRKIEQMWKEIEKGDFPKNMTNCFWCRVKNYCEGESRCFL